MLCLAARLVTTQIHFSPNACVAKHASVRRMRRNLRSIGARLLRPSGFVILEILKVTSKELSTVETINALELWKASCLE